MSDDLLIEINNIFMAELHDSHRRTRRQMMARDLGRVVRAFDHSPSSDVHLHKTVNPLQIAAQNMHLDRLTAHAVRLKQGEDSSWVGMTMARQGVRLHHPIAPRLPLPRLALEHLSPLVMQRVTPRTHVSAWVTATAMGTPGVFREVYEQAGAERLPYSSLWTTEPIATPFVVRAIEEAGFAHHGPAARWHVSGPGQPLPDLSIPNLLPPPLSRLHLLDRL